MPDPFIYTLSFKPQSSLHLTEEARLREMKLLIKGHASDSIPFFSDLISRILHEFSTLELESI